MRRSKEAVRKGALKSAGHVRAVKDRSHRARESVEPMVAEIEQTMSQMRSVNERLVVATIEAQILSEDARRDASHARIELARLMDQLRKANARLVAAAARAQAMQSEASQREEAYRRLSSRLLKAQDEERRRVARDLHDSTVQRLATLTMNLDLVERAESSFGTRARMALAESRSLAEQCTQEVRTQAYLLHPPLLDEAGLPSAIRWFVDGFTKRSGIRVDQDFVDVGRLPESIETALFRVVQESLSNVHRHASSATASIRLTLAADAVELEVRDQGRGFHDELTYEDGTLNPGMLGVGIAGMRERIAELGGSFNIAFTDQGTTVLVHVPLRGQPE